MTRPASPPLPYLMALRPAPRPPARPPARARWDSLALTLALPCLWNTYSQRTLPASPKTCSSLRSFYMVALLPSSGPPKPWLSGLSGTSLRKGLRQLPSAPAALGGRVPMMIAGPSPAPALPLSKLLSFGCLSSSLTHRGAHRILSPPFAVWLGDLE